MRPSRLPQALRAMIRICIPVVIPVFVGPFWCGEIGVARCIAAVIAPGSASVQKQPDSEGMFWSYPCAGPATRRRPAALRCRCWWDQLLNLVLVALLNVTIALEDPR